MQTIAIVAFEEGSAEQYFPSLFQAADANDDLRYISLDPDAASDAIQSENFAIIMLLAPVFDERMRPLLTEARAQLGWGRERMVLVCPHVDLSLQLRLTEFGIFEACARDEAAIRQKVEELMSRRSLIATLDQAFSSAARGLRADDRDSLRALLPTLQGATTSQDVAAFTSGLIAFSQADSQAAHAHFEACLSFNPSFLPAKKMLAETQIIQGNARAAVENIEVLHQCLTPQDGLLAMACAELGDTERAAVHLAAAEGQTASDATPLAETKAHVLLSRGEIDAALASLEGTDDAGMLLAAKLNSTGIGLSKNGEVDAALSLFRKAHTIVREDLRYKVSMNAALAAYRTERYAEALEFLDRCDAESVTPLAKSSKMRAAIQEKMGRREGA